MRGGEYEVPSGALPPLDLIIIFVRVVGVGTLLCNPGCLFVFLLKCLYDVRNARNIRR